MLGFLEGASCRLQYWAQPSYTVCFSANPLVEQAQAFFGQERARGPNFMCRKAPAAHFCIPFALGAPRPGLAARYSSSWLQGLRASHAEPGEDRLSVGSGSCLPTPASQREGRGLGALRTAAGITLTSEAMHNKSPLRCRRSPYL